MDACVNTAYDPSKSETSDKYLVTMVQDCRPSVICCRIDFEMRAFKHDSVIECYWFYMIISVKCIFFWLLNVA